MATRRVIRSAGVAGVLLLLAACSDEKQLDMDELETQIKAELAGPELESLVGDVSCPPSEDVEVEAGGTFECTLSIDGQDVRVKVTQDDDEGNVTLERQDAVLDLASLQDQIATGIAEQTGIDATVDCGGGAVRVAEPGSTLTCKAAEPGREDEYTEVVVTVNDVEGNVDWELA